MKRALIGAGWIAGVLAWSAGAGHAQVTLNANSWVPPSHALVADMMMPFCRDVEKETAGRVKCNLLAKAVVAPPQTFDAVRDGLADISFTVHGYTAGRFPLSEVAEFPFLGDTAEAMSVSYQRLYDSELKKFDEHKGVHTLAVFTHGPGEIYNTKRAVTSLQDLAGMKIRVGGGMVNDVAKALGVVAMLKPSTESYELLSQGVADGVFFPKESSQFFKLLPLVKHVTYIPGGLYNVSFMFMMNPAKLAQISPDDRKIIDKYSGESLARRSGKAWDAMDAKAEAAVQEAKIPVVNASAAFVAEIKSKTDGLEKAWIEKVKAKGADGAALLASLRKNIASYTP